MMRACFLFLALPLVAFGTPSAERIFRPPSHTRGNAGMVARYAIEGASWITHPAFVGKPGEAFIRFRKEFDSDGKPFELDVSGDERYILVLDGEIVSRGPHRGTVGNWLFQSYRVTLPAGRHVLEATVWSAGEKGPRGQFTYRTAFILRADGAYDAQLTTGKAKWRTGLLGGTRFTDLGKSGSFGGGCETCVTGTGLLDEQPSDWQEPSVVLGPQEDVVRWGVRRDGWLLYPSQLPDQIDVVQRPGRVVDGPGLTGTFAPRTRTRILWDLENYYCGYPELKTKGGKGAKIRWGWAESLKDANGRKGDRDAWQGKELIGFGDTFICDGRAAATFTAPWWRCGRWCELVVETADAPLEIGDVRFRETRYPLSKDWSFESSDKSVDEVLAMCRRGLEMCVHETLFDCPFYEQQMYPGDARVELQLLGACTADRRLIRRCVEFFDHGRRNDGFVPMNYPCRLNQESATYSMCYAMMYGDVVRNGGADPAWLRARIPGLRNTMAALQALEDEEGLVVGLPSWTFVDWSLAWNHGEAPDGSSTNRPSAVQNLFWILAMQSASVAERANGDAAQADYWTARAARTFAAVKARFWDAGRGLLADDVDHRHWSEHAQCLAILSGLLSESEERGVFDRMVAATDLARTTVYFSHYLFESCFRHGRGDLFLKKLDLWRDYLKKGLKTPLESPDGAFGPGREARSDCHAWGAHPIYHALTGLAGIRIDASGAVTVCPSPGDLTFIRAKMPHPKGGAVSADLRFVGGEAFGTVTLPDGISGSFVWRGRTLGLASGRNLLPIGATSGVQPPRPGGPETWTFRQELADDSPPEFDPPSGTPWLANRISRCFFAPIKRPPFFRDELKDDIDYYPDNYLERLRREGVNGLWITVVLDDLDGKSLDKLRRTVDKCRRHEIGVWVFCIEPRSRRPDDPFFAEHPDARGVTAWDGKCVNCPCSPAMLSELEGKVARLFRAVPGLSGMINIANGERPTTCLSLSPTTADDPAIACPRCAKREPWRAYADVATAMVRGIRAGSASARLLTWFYQPEPAATRGAWVADCAWHVPDGAEMLYNFESGSVREQVGKIRHGGDYWLSCPGPAEPFRLVSEASASAGLKLAAKIQTSCSHECATVPYVPVPGLLYRKFKGMREAGVHDVMMCWYFGNAPGLMNRAAGLLAYEDFRDGEDAFLKRLARDEWGEDAAVMGGLWRKFSNAYSHYPLSNNMQYYGPFHAGFSWPLYPLISMRSLQRTWKPMEAPGGDLLGEALTDFTLEDAQACAEEMVRELEGVRPVLARLREKHADDLARRRDLGIMVTLMDLFESARDVFGFYRLRRDAVFASRKDGDFRRALEAARGMKEILVRQTAITREMIPLCRDDSRLGFHSEAEAHQFFPAYLEWRLGELARAGRELDGIVAELSAGRSYPESPRERLPLEIAAHELQDGSIVIEGECPDVKPGHGMELRVYDLCGTACARRYGVRPQGGTFKVTLPASDWKDDARLRPAWAVVRQGSDYNNGGTAWMLPDVPMFPEARLNQSALTGDNFARIVVK